MLFGVSRPVVAITGGAWLLAAALALDLTPWLRGGYGWRWPYEPVPAARAILLVGATAIYTGGAWLLLRRTRRPAPGLAWNVLGAAILPLAAIALRHDDVTYELFVRTASPMTTGPHMAAATIDWESDAWHDWPATMRELNERGNRHAALSPPGLPLWNHALNVALDRIPQLTDRLHRALLPYQCHNTNLLNYTPAEWASAWFGILMPLWAALAALPLYVVAARLIGPDAAREVAAWWALVPALVMFAPSWNTLYPVLSLIAFGLLLIGLERGPGAARGALALILAGVTCGLLIFANLSTVPLIGLLGFYTLLHTLNEQRRAWQRAVAVGVWVGVGLALPWLVYGAITGGTPVAIVRAALDAHLELERAYLAWVWLHAWEWALFSGLPLVVLWLVAGMRGIRPAGGGARLALALILTLAVVDLSGLARGETGRVWLFFTPFVLIAARDGLRRLTGGPGRGRPWLAIALGQAALMLALATHWNVIGSELTPPPDPPGGVGAARPADAVFGGALHLRGWDATVQDGVVVLRLDWQADERPTVAYFFSALLVAPDGAPVPQAVVWQPFDTRYPATCWAPGEWVGDTVRLPLPPDAAPGEWWISLSVLGDAARDYQPVPLSSGDGVQIGLGPIAVP